MDKFDVIIVGAGLAGLSAAYTLAGHNLDVLVLERGDYPGAKNMTGGRLYINPVRKLLPELWEQAPLERCITHECITFLAKDRSFTIEYSGNEMRQEPCQSYSILRAKFDRWLAERVEEKGIMVVPKTRVDDVIRENGYVAGVRAGGDELRADVVIVCDGVLSLIAEKAGLRKAGNPGDYAVGIKEVIALAPGAINERFGVEGNEGVARLFVGEVTKGIFGGGFLYTNTDSISLGIVLGLEDTSFGATLPEVPLLLNEFKSRLEVIPFLKGGEIVEYSAHVIPEGGFHALSSLFGNGLLVAGDAAGFALNMGVTVRGMDYAIASGHFAALTVLAAKEKESFSAETLSMYKDMLVQSFVLQDFQNFKDFPRVLKNPRFFAHYPERIGNLLRDIYTIPAGPKEKLFSTFKKHLFSTDL